MRPFSPIVDELRAGGFTVHSIDELRESGVKYGSAIPILLEWLPRLTNDDAKQSVVRALSVPWASPETVHALINEFRTNTPSVNDPAGLGWIVGNALGIVARGSDYEIIEGLVTDRSFGINRQMIVQELWRWKDARVMQTLLSLLDDDDVNGHATIALAKLQDQGAREGLASMTSDHRTWVRNAAKKGFQNS